MLNKIPEKTCRQNKNEQRQKLNNKRNAEGYRENATKIISRTLEQRIQSKVMEAKLGLVYSLYYV